MKKNGLTILFFDDERGWVQDTLEDVDVDSVARVQLAEAAMTIAES